MLLGVWKTVWDTVTGDILSDTPFSHDSRGTDATLSHFSEDIFDRGPLPLRHEETFSNEPLTHFSSGADESLSRFSDERIWTVNSSLPAEELLSKEMFEAAVWNECEAYHISKLTSTINFNRCVSRALGYCLQVKWPHIYSSCPLSMQNYDVPEDKTLFRNKTWTKL